MADCKNHFVNTIKASVCAECGEAQKTPDEFATSSNEPLPTRTVKTLIDEANGPHMISAYPNRARVIALSAIALAIDRLADVFERQQEIDARNWLSGDK